MDKKKVHKITIFDPCIENQRLVYTFTTPAKPQHNYDRVSVHYHYLYCMKICDNLRRDLAIFTYIYRNVDECLLTSSMPQKWFKLHILVKYAVIPENVISED